MLRALSLAAAILLLAAPALADPRMETNDDFCHFIEDVGNTDNEAFLADCGSTIVVDDDAGTATGFAKLVRRLPRGMVESVTFTNEDGGGACTMVESNGTEYASNQWISKIRVIRSWGRKNENFAKHPFWSRLVTVIFELHCLDGARQ